MIGCSLTVRLTDGCTHRSVTNPPGARSRVTVKGGTLEVDIPRGPLFSTERAGTAGFALVLLFFRSCLLPRPSASASLAASAGRGHCYIKGGVVACRTPGLLIRGVHKEILHLCLKTSCMHDRYGMAQPLYGHCRHWRLAA